MQINLSIPEIQEREIFDFFLDKRIMRCQENKMIIS